MGSLCLVCAFPFPNAPIAERESGETDGLFFDSSFNEAFEVDSSPLLLFLQFFLFVRCGR